VRTSTWVKLIVKSAVGAGIIAAAELGVAFALRVIDWTATPVSDTTLGRTAVWVVFIFATAVLGGVAVARHGVRVIRAAIAHRRALAAVARANVRGPVKVARSRALDAARGTAAAFARIGAALAAAIGAGTAFSLVWIPMYYAGVPDRQVRVIVLAAAAGLVVGLVLAVLALYAAPIAAGAAATAGWVWAFGLASVWLATARGDGVGTPAPPRLAVLDAPHLIGPGDWWLGPYLMVGIAAMIGVAVAATARWVGSSSLAVGVCGAAGPLLVTTGYVVVGPVPDLASAYVASLVALTVGLIASFATAAVHRQPTVPADTTGEAAPPAALVPAQAVRAALPAAPTPALPPAPALAIAATPAAGPTRVTLEAEYAARQPNRGAAPVFEVTTVPPAAKPAKPAKPTKPTKPAPSRLAPVPAARTAASQPMRIPDPVPVPIVPAPAPREAPRVAPPPAPVTPTPVASAAPAAPPSTRDKRRRAGQAKNGAKNGQANTGRTEKERGRSTRQSRQERREREHVDWVKNLVNLPNDPSLDLRSKP